jgi:hypothetical protein
MNSKICLLCGRCCSRDAVEQLAAGRKSHEPQMQGLAHSARGNIICHENRKPVSSSQQQQLTQSAAPVTTERVAAQRNWNGISCSRWQQKTTTTTMLMMLMMLMMMMT